MTPTTNIEDGKKSATKTFSKGNPWADVKTTSKFHEHMAVAHDTLLKESLTTKELDERGILPASAFSTFIGAYIGPRTNPAITAVYEMQYVREGRSYKYHLVKKTQEHKAA